MPFGLKQKEGGEYVFPRFRPLLPLLPVFAPVVAAVVSFSLFAAAAGVLKAQGFPAAAARMRFAPAEQVFWLLVCMAAVSLLLFIPSKTLRAVCFSVCLGGLCFICQAIGSYAGIYRYAFTAVIAQASFLFSLPVSTAAVCASVLFSLLALDPHVAFSSPVAGIDFYEAVYLCALAALLFASASAVKFAGRRVQEAREDSRRIEEIMARLSESNLAYQNYAMLTERKAVEKERNRISREIHDIIGYTMTNVLMLIQASIHTQDVEKKNALLENAVEHLTASVDEARLVLRRLRERDAGDVHGAALFFQLARTFQEITGIRTTVDFGNAPREFGRGLERTVLRMLQEALTNSFKHGKADEIRVSFWKEGGWLSVRIHDDGLGSEHRGSVVREGIGIKGMRERIAGAGGHLSAVFADDGFIVQAVLPLDQGEDE